MKVESIEMVTGAEPALLALSNTGSLAASIDDGHTWMHNLQGLNEEPFRVIRRHPLHAGYVMAGLAIICFFRPTMEEHGEIFYQTIVHFYFGNRI